MNVTDGINARRNNKLEVIHECFDDGASTPGIGGGVAAAIRGGNSGGEGEYTVGVCLRERTASQIGDPGVECGGGAGASAEARGAAPTLQSSGATRAGHPLGGLGSSLRQAAQGAAAGSARGAGKTRAHGGGSDGEGVTLGAECGDDGSVVGADTGGGEWPAEAPGSFATSPKDAGANLCRVGWRPHRRNGNGSGGQLRHHECWQLRQLFGDDRRGERLDGMRAGGGEVAGTHRGYGGATAAGLAFSAAQSRHRQWGGVCERSAHRILREARTGAQPLPTLP